MENKEILKIGHKIVDLISDMSKIEKIGLLEITKQAVIDPLEAQWKKQ